MAFIKPFLIYQGCQSSSNLATRGQIVNKAKRMNVNICSSFKLVFKRKLCEPCARFEKMRKLPFHIYQNMYMTKPGKNPFIFLPQFLLFNVKIIFITKYNQLISLTIE